MDHIQSAGAKLRRKFPTQQSCPIESTAPKDRCFRQMSIRKITLQPVARIRRISASESSTKNGQADRVHDFRMAVMSHGQAASHPPAPCGHGGRTFLVVEVETA